MNVERSTEVDILMGLVENEVVEGLVVEERFCILMLLERR